MPEIKKHLNDTVELILQSTIEYINIIHSIINKRPIDIIHSFSPEFEAEIKLIRPRNYSYKHN